MTMLEISALRKSFVRHLFDGKRIEVLRGVDLTLEHGTCTLVRGPSGSGKSSLLRCIYRSALPDGGAMLLRTNGATLDLAQADDRTVLDVRRTSVALATQFLSVVPRVSAIDLVCAQGVERAEALELLLQLGLPQEMIDVPPATYSGGQRQMLNIALALARPRPVLLLDEVTASLDPRRKAIALSVLLERKRSGATMLMVSHEMPQVEGLVDSVVALQDGMVVAA